MPITFVAAETGGGKGIFSVIEIEKYLEEGKRVATNMDLFLEHFNDEVETQSVTRLPDKPTRRHMLELGYGSDPTDKNKHHYGLIVLDEISLFLDTKRSLEFVGLYNWFKQRRKFHWDIIFICQHPDQIQDEFYKALCNNLVMCQERDLIPIPYFGPLLRGLGMSGNMSDGHFYTRYIGKSQMDTAYGPYSYENKPHRNKYDTDQFFDEGLEYMDDGSEHDMRATYTYLPKTYLVEKNFLGNQTTEEVTEMAKPDYMLKSKLKFKTYAILGVMGFAMWMVFKPGNKTIEQPKTVQQTFIPQPYATKEKEPEPEFDFVTYLFKNFHPQVTSLIRTTERTVVVIDFIDVENSWVHQAMTDEDFKILGYETYETANGLLVKNKENSYVISRRQPFQTRDIKYRNKSQQMQTQ